MRGRPVKALLVIIGGARHDAAHAGLSLAAAAAALGRQVFVHLHAEAVRIADPAMEWIEDQHFAACGLPAVGDLLAAALDLGVTVNACQSGLALTGLAAGALAPGVQASGLIDVLARAVGAEIVMA